MDLAAALPRAAEWLDMRCRRISRILGNESIDIDAVMAPYGREFWRGHGRAGNGSS
jgi:hypothetical protein